MKRIFVFKIQIQYNFKSLHILQRPLHDVFVEYGEIIEPPLYPQSDIDRYLDLYLL